MSLIFKTKGASSEIKKDGYELSNQGVLAWLQYRNIVSSFASLLEYQDCNDWCRTGGETYCCYFKIKYEEEGLVKEKLINIKAIISTPVEASIENWKRRREILKSNKIPVSNWYFVGDGIIIEDFYPQKAKDVNNVLSLVDIAYTLDKLGFRGTGNFVRDVLCDGEGNAFYVDFGFDLGEPDYIFRKIAINTVIAFFPKNTDKIKKYLETSKIHYKK